MTGVSNNRLSVIIITLNAERRLREVLESVKFADEIIVVDSFSSDKTVAIASQFTKKVFQREWSGYSDQWNFAIAEASGDWVLALCSDEIVTTILQREIIKVVEKENNKTNGYHLKRLSFFLGKPIYHCGWYPGYQLRLFRRGEGKFNSKEVHEHLEVIGGLGYLEGDLLHYTYDSIHQYLERMNRYTDLEVKERLKTEKPQELKFTRWGLIKRPLKVFRKMYFRQKGYKDQMPGLVLCLLSSIYRFIGDIKLWEKSQGAKCA